MFSGVLRKVKTTGTEEPFNARLMFGIFELRDKMVKNNETERLEFDNLYTPILETLEETQEAMNNVVFIVNDHKAKVEKGEIIEFQNEIIQVNETVDKELKKNFKDFFVKGNRSIGLLVPLFKHYSYNIGFLFKSDKEFAKGRKKFEDKSPGEKQFNFLTMIEQDRKSWFEPFVEARRKVEHEGFSLPDIKYAKRADGSVISLFPTIDNTDIVTVLQYFWQNLFEFIEDCVVCLIDMRLEKPWMIISVPEEKRDKSMPLKYKIWLEGLSEFLEKEKLKEAKDQKAR